ncbi:TPR end-of-group domain-containing protein [Flindersiella endophytica]
MLTVTEYRRTVSRAKARSKRGQWREAAALWDQVVATNPVKGDYWDWLAEARFELGDYAEALRAYEKVRELGVWSERDSVFHGVPAFRIACCHAELGDTDQALEAIADALRDRFRQLELLRQDERLASVRDDPRFAELLGVPDVEGLSRDEGWQADLAFAAREAKRRKPLRFDDAVEQELDAGFARLREEVPGLTDAQVVVRLQQLLRKLRDGHAFAEPPKERDDLNLLLPVQFYLFEEGVFVTATDPAYGSALGAKVLAFDGKPIGEVVAALDTVICRDNEWTPKERQTWWLRKSPTLHALGLTEDPGKVTLTLDSGELVVVAEPRRTSTLEGEPAPPGWLFLPETLDVPVPLYLRNASAPYWFEYLEAERLVYFQFNAVMDDPEESLEEFSRRLVAFIDGHDVERLVVDMRWNGGGNTFLVRPLLHRLIACEKVNRKGSLFLIIGRGTFSAAQNTSTWIEWHTEATLVGEPTGSRPVFIGETIPFTLPYSKVRVNVSDLYWKSSIPMDQRTWLAPELYTPPTFEAFQANRDPAMEAILAATEQLPG